MPPAKPPEARSPRGGRITLREVAQALNVSVATVSNAYNRPDQLSQELRERVLEKIGRASCRERVCSTV